MTYGNINKTGRLGWGLLTLLAALSAGVATFAVRDVVAAVACGVGEKEVTQTILVDNNANDLIEIPSYNPDTGVENILVPGGTGTLNRIITSWTVGDETEASFDYDINTGTFLNQTSDAEFLGKNNNEYTFRFCGDLLTDSTTNHAIYTNQGALTGIRSGVGLTNERTTLVLNAATEYWFEKFNKGKERSGSQIILNTIQLHQQDGALITTTPLKRLLAEKLVIGLNGIYAPQLVAGQLRAIGDNIDARGTTIYVEDKNNNNLCFGSATNNFSIEGINKPIDAQGCVGNITNNIGKPYLAETIDGKITGTIEDGELGTVNATCSNNTLTVAYSGTPLNIETTVEQGTTTNTYDGNNITATVSGCNGITITSAPQGMNKPLYEKVTEIGTQGPQYSSTVETFVKDNGTSLVATGTPSEEIIKLVWGINNVGALVGNSEYICEPPFGTAVSGLDEVISNVNGLSTTKKFEFYGESPDGMVPYVNDSDGDGSVCDPDEPDNGYSYLVRLSITQNW